MSSDIDTTKLGRSIDKIWLVESITDMGYFLTLYKKEKNSVVFVCKELAENAFVVDVVGDKHLIEIPRLPNFCPPDPPLEEWSSITGPIRDLRGRLAGCFQNLRPGITVYLFTIFSVFHHFVAVALLRKMGAKIVFVDCDTYMQIIPSDPGRLRAPPRSQAYGAFLEDVSEAIGERIIEVGFTPSLFETPPPEEPSSMTAIGYSLAEKPRRIYIEPLPWIALFARYSLPSVNVGDRDVLYLETLFATLPGIKQDETRENIIHFLRSRISSGENIHFKAAPSSSGNFFAGTGLEKDIYVLEPAIPAEAFIPHYRRMYFCLSGLAQWPVKGDKVSLIELVEFESSTTEQRYRAVERFCWKTEHDKIFIISALLKQLPRCIWRFLPTRLLVGSPSVKGTIVST
jgi:hypothetical protein